jgi:hypothetical protein
MSLYDDASLILYPSGYKEDKIYSLKPTDGSGDLTFTRASTATRVNADGLIETSPYNLLQQSNSYDSVSWTKTVASVTSGQAGYDGTSDAWLLEATAPSGSLRQNYSASGVFCLSVYAKAGSTDWIRISFIDAGSHNAWFDLSTGSVGTATGINADITSVGAGWYRINIAANVSSLVTVRFYPASSDGTNGVTGNNVYIQNAQLNSGATAKPYFPTTDRLNVPRIDYTGGGCGKLLLEPQRTNLVTYSEQFDNAAWSKSDSTITSNAAISPDGTTNADKLIDNITLAGHSLNSATSMVSGTTYTFSIFAKMSEIRYLTLRYISGGAFSTNYITTFDLLNGTATNSATFPASSFLITSFGNGWYKCSISQAANATGTGTYAAYLSKDGVATTYTGNGTDGLYIYGAQLEAGSYVSSYIPTSGTAVTRLADAASKTGISSLINSVEGVLYGEIAALYDDGTNRGIAISDGTSSNRVYVSYTTTTNQITGVYTYSGTTQVSINETLTDSTQFIKFAFKYKENDCAFWVNGIEVGTDNTATEFAADTLDTLNFDSGAGGSIFYGKCQNLMVFPSALTDTELATLTTL